MGATLCTRAPGSPLPRFFTENPNGALRKRTNTCVERSAESWEASSSWWPHSDPALSSSPGMWTLTVESAMDESDAYARRSGSPSRSVLDVEPCRERRRRGEGLLPGPGEVPLPLPLRLPSSPSPSPSSLSSPPSASPLGEESPAASDEAGDTTPDTTASLWRARWDVRGVRWGDGCRATAVRPGPADTPTPPPRPTLPSVPLSDRSP